MNNQYSMVTRDQRAAGQKRKEATENDKFPVGMRVFILESGNSSREVALKNLLLQCQYNVTTMNHARDIVRILRENRNKFDLVVVDVAMLDTSCFKLLDLIENDFNIPLVVISGNSDHKLVKKAIELGASDYLLKPLRIEEIRNIWQHAFRRKYPHLIAKPSTSGATPQEEQTTIQALVNANNSELYRVLNENDDANGSDENEDSSSSRKKTRIVWTMDLHSKFVAVVNQLGLEKAVPKRILELMGVEDLTRENIASHLQKYRMYLRRTGCSLSEQADTVPALGGSPSYLHLTPSERNRAWGGAKGLPYYNMPQLSPGVPFGSQLSDAPRSSSELTETSEQQPSNHVQLSGLPSSNSALQSTQPMPSNLVQSNQGSSRELINHLSDTHSIARRMKVSALIPNKKSDFVQGNTSSNGLDLSQERTSARNLKIPGPNNSFPDVSNNLLESPRHILFMAKSGIQSNISPFKDPSNIGLRDSSLHALDNGTSNGNWQSYNQFQQFLPAPLPFTGDFSQNQPARNNLTNEFSSTSRIAGDSHQNQSSFFTNQAANMNFPRAQWDFNYNGNAHDGIGCFQSPMPTAYGDSSNQLLGVGQYGVGDFNADFTKQFNTAPESGQQCAVGNFTMEANMTANDVYVPTQPQTQDEYVPNGADSIDEILNAMVKQDQETSLYGDDDFNFNKYSF